MNSKSTHKLTIAVVCLLCLAIFSSSVFATVIGSERYSFNTYIDGGGQLLCYVTSLGSHIVNADIEYTQSSNYPSYTIYPTDSNGSHLTSISSTTSNSLGGSINLNSPTSTGSQSGRYTIANFSTVTSLYGFKAVPTGGSNTNTQHTYYVTQYDFIFYVRIANGNNYTCEFDTSYFSFLPNFSFVSTPSLLGSSIEPLEIHGIFFDSINNDGSFTIVRDSDHLYNGHLLLAPNETLYCQYKISFYGMFTDNYSTDIPNVTGSFISKPNSCTRSNAPAPSTLYQLVNLNNTLQLTYEDLHSLKEAYISANNTYDDTQGQAVKDDAESKTQTIETIHDSEMQYYNQNKQAIEDTGLTNFNYSPEQISSFSVLITDFNNLWNALDGWTFVYTFSLMLSLALLIIRHKPVTRDKGGGKDA